MSYFIGTCQKRCAEKQIATKSWNMKTSNWLTRYVYMRTNGSLVATYSMSAFWHGFVSYTYLLLFVIYFDVVFCLLFLIICLCFLSSPHFTTNNRSIDSTPAPGPNQPTYYGLSQKQQTNINKTVSWILYMLFDIANLYNVRPSCKEENITVFFKRKI